jgi:alkylation response protein AidB-like acyl-CoA dehydrogenase
MDFALTEDQEALRSSVTAFATRDLGADLGVRDRAGTFDREAWDRCARFGIQGLPLPAEHGGAEADVVTLMVAMEALGYACKDNGLLFSMNAQMWACQTPLVRFGSPTQKAKYLPGLADGSLIAAHGMSEPGSGSDAFALRTRAVASDDGWVLNGSKTFVTNAPIADLLLVFASTNPSRGFFGISAFLLDRDTPGLTIGPPLDKMGLRTSPMSEVFFDDCAVPAEALLGKQGAGFALFNAAMLMERSLILACTVGSMQRGLERSLAHACEREQFGKPIGSFQAVSHRLVDMKLRLETSRLLLYRLGWLLDTGRPAELDAALVKLHLSESFVTSSLDALQIHGGYGYMTEQELERDVRDALGSRLYSGTSDIQKNLAALHLGLKP